MITTKINKQVSKKQIQKQTMLQANEYMYSSNSKQWKKFNEVCCCVWKNFQNGEIFAKYLIQNRYYGSVFTSMFLHSL